MDQASNRICEIGRMYLVPCMHTTVDGVSWFPADGWVPVFGPKHTDTEHLNFPYEHYHIDWRFVPERSFRRAEIGWFSNSALRHVLTNTHGGHTLEGKPVLKLRKCRRTMPEFPRRPKAEWQEMELAQRASCPRLKPGNICPHRGIDLTPFAKPDGTAICPGHGLRWNLATGELLAHHAPEAC